MQRKESILNQLNQNVRDNVPKIEQTITGIIKKIIYTNPQNYWTVMKIETDSGENVTVVGKFIGLHEGLKISLDGNYHKNPKYGLQFAALSYVVFEPSSIDGIKEYLGSGLIKGIGPVFAERIVNLFGEKTLDVIDNTSHLLLKVEGIGQKKLQSIIKSWEGERGRRNAMIKLKGLGLSTSRALKIIENYGSESYQKVVQNPYCLAEDVWGIGFKTADEIAQKIGIAKDSPQRIRAGILHALKVAADDGHCYFPENELINFTAEILQLDIKLIREDICNAINDDVIYAEDKYGSDRGIYLKTLLRAEEGVAQGLSGLACCNYEPETAFIKRGIQLIEKSLMFSFSETQKRAIKLATAEKISVITGVPGTGKTTIVKAILQIALQTDRKIALCAPTGRAAKRMSEACSFTAKTIHRLLEFNPKDNKFRRNEDNNLEANLIIVDEASMIDIFLFNSLLSAIKPKARLVLVGDADQLPSVGPGNLLADIINSGVVPVAVLNEIFRQEEGSLIVKNAHRVIRGENIEIPEVNNETLTDFYFIERENPETLLKTVCDLVSERIPEKFKFDPVTEIQLICPMHRGEIGAENINRVLRDLLNPVQLNSDNEANNNTSFKFRQGDKVMQLKNDYEKDVFNGDVGMVKDIDKEEGLIIVDFYGRDVVYASHELDEMTLAYAMTIHKSQGSEYNAVIVVLHTQHYIMLQRNLLYTAITRGKKLLIIVGNKKALYIAINNNKIKNRYTRLKDRLMEYIG